MSATTTEQPRKELLLSQLLTLHLDLAIKRYKDPLPMSKFLLLADDIKKDLADWDEQAEELSAMRIRNKQNGDELFADHRGVQQEIAEGFAKMAAVLHDMGGSNSRKAGEKEKPKQATEQKTETEETPKLGEASEGTSGSSFQGNPPG